MHSPYQNRLARAKDAVQNAEVLLIGGGAGLSAAAGLTYSGPRFEDNFADFIERYRLTDMYSSAFYPFPTPEEHWAYFSRHIQINRYDDGIGEPYRDLFEMAKGRDHFVLTTNVDAQFFKAGFNPQNVFATQGDYGLFQCKTACHDRLYDNKETVQKMVAQQSDFRIPSELIPICPVCGGPLVPHLRVDRFFVQNQDWHDASRRYERFTRSAMGRNIVILELGVGYNTPGIIKYPFEELAAVSRHATLIRINRDHPEVSESNRDKTIAFDEDLGAITKRLAATPSSGGPIVKQALKIIQ